MGPPLSKPVASSLPAANPSFATSQTPCQSLGIALLGEKGEKLNDYANQETKQH